MKNLKVGICGWGNVATGLYKTINNNKTQILSNSNLVIDIIAIGARSDNPKCSPENTIIERDIFDVLNHDIDVMVELIGGVEVARDLILQAINKGIHVVTANKAVIFHHGDEIFEQAKEKNVNVLFESSVCAGTPIIKMLKEELAANKVTKISGMLNGTSNFILSKMEEGADFDETLSLAQKEGYAEPDPSFDIEGMDAAHKIGILSALSLGTSLPPEDFYIEGITNIESDDFKYASEIGYSIKHLAVAAFSNNNIELRAHPVLIDSSAYLSNLKGVRNGIEIETDLVGTLHIAGSGAGQESTASGVISDLVYLSNLDKNYEDQSKEKIKNTSNIFPMQQLKFKNYFHLKTESSNDAISKIKNIFDESKIEIDLIESKKNSDGKESLIIISKLISDKDKDAVVLKINELDIIDNTKTIRIES